MMEFLRSDFKTEIEQKCKESSGGVKVNFFELLHTPYGFEALQTWFYSQSGSEIDEYGLWKILKTLSDNITETSSWEIFDTLAQDVTISFKEFVMIIFLFAAAETGQLKLLLYLHGKKFYQLLSGGEKQDICFERLKRIGRILKINESYLVEKGRELSICYMKVPFNFEHFEVFYFKVFSELDSTQPEIIEEPVEIATPPRLEIINEVDMPISQPELPLLRPPEPHREKNKKKSSCTGCKSKACNLL